MQDQAKRVHALRDSGFLREWRLGVRTFAPASAACLAADMRSLTSTAWLTGSALSTVAARHANCCCSVKLFTLRSALHLSILHSYLLPDTCFDVCSCSLCLGDIIVRHLQWCMRPGTDIMSMLGPFLWVHAAHMEITTTSIGGWSPLRKHATFSLLCWIAGIWMKRMSHLLQCLLLHTRTPWEC